MAKDILAVVAESGVVEEDISAEGTLAASIMVVNLGIMVAVSTTHMPILATIFGGGGHFVDIVITAFGLSLVEGATAITLIAPGCLATGIGNGTPITRICKESGFWVIGSIISNRRIDWL